MSATVLPQPDEIRPDRFLPSSRSVAFTRAGWEAAGRYPEWLDYCEDLVFDLTARAAGPYAMALDAIAYFRPRGSLRSFWRQYYVYARGDGKAGLWPRRHLIRYATYLAALPALIAGAVAAPLFWVQALCVAALSAGAAVYLRAPLRRLRRPWQGFSAGDRLRAALWTPVLRAAGDAAKMAGYPVGVIWRLRNRARPELRWR